MIRFQVPNEYEGYTWIGNILGAHGIQGELKVQPITDTPEYYQTIRIFFIDDQAALRMYPVKTFRMHKNNWIIQFQRIVSRDEAESLRGYHLFLEDHHLRPLEDDEYFIHQIVGCRVEDMQGKHLGTVVDVFETVANDIYVVREGTEEFLLPAIESILKHVDIERQILRVDIIPGMIEN